MRRLGLSHPRECPRDRRREAFTGCCSCCDLLVGLDGLDGVRVTAVEFDHDVGLLTVRMESPRVADGLSRGVVSSRAATAGVRSRWSTRHASTGLCG